MDKTDFIKIAPPYYEFAVLLAFKDEHGYVPEFRIRNKYFERHPESSDPEDGYSLIENEELLKLAIDNLVKRQAVEALLDPFGPSQFREGEGLSAYMEEARADKGSPLYKGEASGDADKWLRHALENLNARGRELNISVDEWRSPEKEWEPIPIERDDEAFLRAEAALDKTIDEIEKSNGYASEHPEERNFVLERLKILSTKLKTAKEVSIAYVRANGIEALRKIGQRFGTALIGKLADAAVAAILSWLGLR